MFPMKQKQTIKRLHQYVFELKYESVFSKKIHLDKKTIYNRYADCVRLSIRNKGVSATIKL